MIPQASHTAVLLFTRSSVEEARAKSFCRSRSKSETIASGLIQRSHTLVQQAGLPLIVIDSARQQGHSFGERLQHAFTQAFAQGFERVVCLGNDTPGLTPDTLRAAASALQQQDFVFGQATDGGVYLMGMHRHAFHQIDFKAISWNTPLVFEELCRQTAAATTVILAPILPDADTAEDVLVLSAQRSLGKFAAWLRNLLVSFRSYIDLYTSPIPQHLPATDALRGPPLS